MTTVEQIPGLGNGKQNVIIPPSNNPSSNSYSFEGNNLVQFQIPNSMVLLNPSTIRISGSLRFVNNAGMTQGAAGDWASIFQDPYLGINTVFRTVEFSSTGGNRQSIEKVQNYPQMLQCILPALNNTSDYLSKMQSGNLASQNIEYGSQYVMQNASFYNGAGDGKAFGIRFSTPLYTGLTMASGQKLPLAHLNGLTVTLELASNTAVFVSNEADATLIPNIKYELFDLKLECELYQPTAPEREALMSQKNGTLMCNTFTSLFSVLQSANNNSQFNLGIKELISVFFKFIPTKAVNNLSLNEYQSTRLMNSADSLQQIIKARFMRSGTEFPLMFPINVVGNSNEAELNKYYLQALKNVNVRRDPKVSVSNQTNDPRFAIGSNGFKFETASQITAFNKSNVVYGVGYDYFSSMSGANFDGKPLTLNIESNLSDGNTNAMYVFVLAKTMIAFSDAGVQVMN
jgi:hypothetical protein